jgi:hypothetical protein
VADSASKQHCRASTKQLGSQMRRPLLLEEAGPSDGGVGAGGGELVVVSASAQRPLLMTQVGSNESIEPPKQL